MKLLKDWFLEVAKKLFEKESLNEKKKSSVCFATSDIHQALGEFEEALSWISRAVELCEKVNGKENVEYATGLNNKAEVLRSLGRYEETLPLYEEAIKI